MPPGRQAAGGTDPNRLNISARPRPVNIFTSKRRICPDFVKRAALPGRGQPPHLPEKRRGGGDETDALAILPPKPGGKACPPFADPCGFGRSRHAAGGDGCDGRDATQPARSGQSRSRAIARHRQSTTGNPGAPGAAVLRWCHRAAARHRPHAGHQAPCPDEHAGHPARGQSGRFAAGGAEIRSAEKEAAPWPRLSCARQGLAGRRPAREAGPRCATGPCSRG